MVAFRWFLLPVLFFIIGALPEGHWSSAERTAAEKESMKIGGVNHEDVLDQVDFLNVVSNGDGKLNASETAGDGILNGTTTYDLPFLNGSRVGDTDGTNDTLDYHGDRNDSRTVDDGFSVVNATAQHTVGVNISRAGHEDVNDTATVERKANATRADSYKFVNATGNETGIEEALGKSFDLEHSLGATIGCSLPCPLGTSCKLDHQRRYACVVNRLVDVVATDPCSPNPCLGGGACSRDKVPYSCACVYPLHGVDCAESFLPASGCVQNPCRNGGVCLLGVSGYACSCKHGFSGKDCEFHRLYESGADPCSPNPCNNDGECTKTAVSYECACVHPYHGLNCNQAWSSAPQRCLPNPCYNGGTCHEDFSSYSCKCRHGFTGGRCEHSDGVVGCSRFSPCLHGGVCVFSGKMAVCTCPDDRTGDRCQFEQRLVNSCSSKPCMNGGFCGSDKSACICPLGFSGDSCQILAGDACSRNPCAHGGVCSAQGDGYHCACPTSYHGAQCEHKSGDCTTTGCMNGGVCKESRGRTTCTCPHGFAGSKCENSLEDGCSQIRCQNGGFCSLTGGTYGCTCPYGFTGSHCDIHDGDACALNPCANGGLCIPQGTSYSCNCPTTHHGAQCEYASDGCRLIQCLNGGVCTSSRGKGVCKCADGYSGTKCEIRNSDPCAWMSCDNGGVCTSRGSRKCTCRRGYYGPRCQRIAGDFHQGCLGFCLNRGLCSYVNGNPSCTCTHDFVGARCQASRAVERALCLPRTCLNGGTCSSNGRYLCSCKRGFSGMYCETPENACASNPCRNGGACNIDASGYYCDCHSTYYGRLCELKKIEASHDDPCAARPCQNRATCHEAPYGGYFCACDRGFFGELCEKWISEAEPCSPNPCLNGGRCMSAPLVEERYECDCVEPYGGSHCEEMRGADPCSARPCQNDCECQPSCRHASGYYCRSARGFLGKNCAILSPRVECRPNEVLITVDDAFVQEYDRGIGNSRLYLATNVDGITSSDCFAAVSNKLHSFTIPLPFKRCGTDVDTTGPRTTVTNTIWLGRFATTGDFDMPVPVVTFECAYKKEYSIVTTLEPVINHAPVVRGQGINRVTGEIQLCKVQSTCPQSCPAEFAITGGAVYTVGQRLHLNIQGDNSPQEVLALSDLHLSCDLPLSSAGGVQLVSDGCPSSSPGHIPTTVSYSGKGPSICVHFQVPRLRGCTVFYIHADVEICGPGGCKHSDASCRRSGRRRRSFNIDDSFTDTFGPIHVLYGAFGQSNLDVFPNTTVVRTAGFINDKDQKIGSKKGPGGLSRGQTAYIVVAAFCLALMMVALIACAVNAYRRQRGCCTGEVSPELLIVQRS